MTRRIQRYIEENCMIENGDHVVAGISGGADSVCLLLILKEYQKEKDFSLSVVHVNHMIRKEANKDALFVKDLCTKLNVPFYLFEIDVTKRAKEQGLSTEEAGRQARYEAYQEILRKEHLENNLKGKIAVGHHQGDVAETMLFHLFRGTGLQGLASISPVRENVIRPLLCMSKSDIEQFLKDRNQDWCIDYTNDEDTYTRNKIRNKILPYVEKEINPNATAHIASAAGKMDKLKKYIETQTKQALSQVTKKMDGTICIYVGLFMQLDPFMQEQVVLAALEELTPARKDITQIHVTEVIGLCKKEGYHTIDLPYCLEAVKNYDTITIRTRKNNETDTFYQKVEVPSEYILPDGSRMKFTLLSGQKEGNTLQKTYTKWFDYDKIIHCLVLRNRCTGDYLTINEACQKKTLKQYMIDEKVPKEDRDRTFVLTDEHHILWVVGKRISEAYKVSNATKRILVAEYIEKTK